MLQEDEKEVEEMFAKYTKAHQEKTGRVRALSSASSKSSKTSRAPPHVTTVNLVPHPTPITEPTSLLAAGRKPTAYAPMLPVPVLASGKLSSAQYESLIRAGHAMEKLVENAKGQIIYRKGFIIGDGTGIGKGRQIGAIIG